MDEPERRPDQPGDVAAYYDRLAPVYGDGEVFGARRAAVLSAIAPDLAASGSVLDLGCGNGTYATEFVRRAPAARVVGADLSASMLQEARRRLGERVAVVRADATTLPFRRASFDLVFMSHVLQLIEDVEKCVAEVASCLAPAGRWITTVGVSGWREALVATLGAQSLQELAALVASARSRPPSDDKERVAAACARSGLACSWRSAPFSVAWHALEEWVRIRWFTVVDAAARTRAEEWLARVRPRDGLTLSVAETLLVAHKA